MQRSTRDLSMGGIFLYTQQRISEGSKLEIVLILPAELGLGRSSGRVAKASVVRVEDDGGQQNLEWRRGSTGWTYCLKFPPESNIWIVGQWGGASQTRVSLIVIASFFVHPQGVIRSGCVNIFKRLAPIGSSLSLECGSRKILVFNASSRVQ